MNSTLPTPRMLEDFKQAIRTRNITEIYRVVDVFRDEHRMSYGTCFCLAKVLTEITLSEWEELLFEAESQNQW